MADDAPSTSSLWGSMFGIAPLLKLVQDPAFAENSHKLVASVIAGQAAIVRCEAKLDFLLRLAGHDPARFANADAPVVLIGMPDRAGGHSVAGPAPDHGAGGGAAGHDPHGGGLASFGADDAGGRSRALRGANGGSLDGAD